MTSKKDRKYDSDPFNGSNLKDLPIPEEFPEGSFGSPFEPKKRLNNEKLAFKVNQNKDKIE